jgi:hypothetical protein
LIKLVEIKLNQKSDTYYLNEILINPDYIVSITEEVTVTEELRLHESKRPNGLDSRARIVEIILSDNKRYNVVGSTEMILNKLTKYPQKTRIILKD